MSRQIPPPPPPPPPLPPSPPPPPPPPPPTHTHTIHQSQFKTSDSKCLALIAQMVRAFGMNLKVGGSILSQVEKFSVSKTLTLSQKHPFVCRKWMLLPAQVNSSNVNFTSKTLNQCILHFWSTSGDPSLNGWWAMVRTSSKWGKLGLLS